MKTLAIVLVCGAVLAGAFGVYWLSAGLAYGSVQAWTAVMEEGLPLVLVVDEGE